MKRRINPFYWLATVWLLLAGNLYAGITEDFSQSDESNVNIIDHSAWQQLLTRYLVVNDKSGVNLFAYAKVKDQDKALLKRYLTKLQGIDPRDYRKAEQQAYWINLYNALTVDLILNHYPVVSITKLGETFFAFGPWDDEAANVANHSLSLNHIEHQILRPIWQDPRIHYAVNCASFGCPNLSARAFTAANTNDLLNQGAVDYVNHPRGVKVKGDEIRVSSIYHWYLDDFGGDHLSLIQHLKQYAKPALKAKLKTLESKRFDLEHDYDWQLNEAKKR